jgi:predicted nucleic acid-binding Zn ribbon protein
MINHNATVATITAPQDAEIATLGAKLNSTYVGYGHKAKEAQAMQAAQDTNAAAAAPAAAAERAVSKASAMYDNSGWDVVDARKAGKKVEEMKDDELPAEMKGMNKEERKAYVDGKEKEREQIQQRITELSKQRDAYITEENKKQGSGDATLDKALIESVKTQGAKKDFKF